MSDNQRWIQYANENIAVAELSLGAGLFNACIQNAQQAVEKFLKVKLIEKKGPFKKTHSIETLHRELQRLSFDTDLSLDDCELLDAIYIPSKYPMGNALPDFTPDKEICDKVIEIAKRVQNRCTE